MIATHSFMTSISRRLFCCGLLMAAWLWAQGPLSIWGTGELHTAQVPSKCYNCGAPSQWPCDGHCVCVYSLKLPRDTIRGRP